MTRLPSGESDGFMNHLRVPAGKSAAVTTGRSDPSGRWIQISDLPVRFVTQTILATLADQAAMLSCPPLLMSVFAATSSTETETTSRWSVRCEYRTLLPSGATIGFRSISYAVFCLKKKTNSVYAIHKWLGESCSAAIETKTYRLSGIQEKLGVPPKVGSFCRTRCGGLPPAG